MGGLNSHSDAPSTSSEKIYESRRDSGKKIQKDTEESRKDSGNYQKDTDVSQGDSGREIQKDTDESKGNSGREIQKDTEDSREDSSKATQKNTDESRRDSGKEIPKERDGYKGYSCKEIQKDTEESRKDSGNYQKDTDESKGDSGRNIQKDTDVSQGDSGREIQKGTEEYREDFGNATRKDTDESRGDSGKEIQKDTEESRKDSGNYHTTTPQRKSAEEPQGDIQPSDCSKKSTSAMDFCDGAFYEWLAKIFDVYLKKKETTEGNVIAYVMLETEDKSADTTMSRSEKAVELQGNPQPKYRNKNLKLVAMINGDTQQSNPVINIDLGRLTKEVEKIRETKPENVAVQEDKSALHMRKETPDENLTASVIPSKDKTAAKENDYSKRDPVTQKPKEKDISNRDHGTHKSKEKHNSNRDPGTHKRNGQTEVLSENKTKRTEKWKGDSGKQNRLDFRHYLPWPRKVTTDIFYYQQEKGRHFQKFCDTFLKHLTVKELEFDEPIPERLFLVFYLPSVNRQNKVDVISTFIGETTMGLIYAKDIKDIILIQISFDGNNSINPPNVINESIFESVKRNVEWDIASYVNIIYTDMYTFEDCDINRSAVRELYSLSNKH